MVWTLRNFPDRIMTKDVYFFIVYSTNFLILHCYLSNFRVSHFPKDVKLGRTVGLGMNAYELSKNVQLTETVAKDLNIDPTFPFPDNSFDFVTCVVSTDYLTRPLEVFSEIRRVLKPNGMAIMSQSNRCFPTKAINIWLNTNDAQHIFIIGSYFHFAGGFQPPESLDISPNLGRSDPMFIIQAKKAA